MNNQPQWANQQAPPPPMGYPQPPPGYPGAPQAPPPYGMPVPQAQVVSIEERSGLPNKCCCCFDLRTGVLAYCYVMAIYAGIYIIIDSVALDKKGDSGRGVSNVDKTPVGFIVVHLLNVILTLGVAFFGIAATTPFARIAAYDPIIVKRTIQFFWLKTLDFVVTQGVDIGEVIIAVKYRDEDVSRGAATGFAIFSYLLFLSIHIYLYVVVYAYMTKLKNEARGIFIGGPAFARPGQPDTTVGVQMVQVHPNGMQTTTYYTNAPPPGSLYPGQYPAYYQAQPVIGVPVQGIPVASYPPGAAPPMQGGYTYNAPPVPQQPPQPQYNAEYPDGYPPNHPNHPQNQARRNSDPEDFGKPGAYSYRGG